MAAEIADGINVYSGGEVIAKELLEVVSVNCKEFKRDFVRSSKPRNVDVIFSDSASDLEGSTCFGTPKKVEVMRSMTLDEQLGMMKVKKFAKYVMLSERYVTGSSEEVTEDLNGLVSSGFDQIIAGEFENLEGLKRFAEEVIPHMR